MPTRVNFNLQREIKKEVSKLFEADVQKVATLLSKTLRRSEDLPITGAVITLAPGWTVEVDAMKQEYFLRNISTGLIVEEVAGQNLTNFRRAVWYHKASIDRAAKGETGVSTKRKRSRK
jgi:hypothetical protein